MPQIGDIVRLRFPQLGGGVNYDAGTEFRVLSFYPNGNPYVDLPGGIQVDASDFSSTAFEVVNPTAPPPTAAPLPPSQWLEGDILERITQGHGSSRTAVGGRVTFVNLRAGESVTVSKEDGQTYTMGSRYLRFVERPVAATQIAFPASAQEWLPGDILQRKPDDRQPDAYPHIPRGAEVILMSVGGEYATVTNSTGNYTCYHNRFNWVRRPDTITMPINRPSYLDVGARVLVTHPTYSGRAASIDSNSNSSYYYLWIDGYPDRIRLEPKYVAALEVEPEVPAFVPNPNTTYTWLDVTGATKEEIADFVAQLKNLSFKDSYFKEDHGWGNNKSGPKTHSDGSRSGILFNTSRDIYLHRFAGATSTVTGSLLRDWNKVILWAQGKYGTATKEAAVEVAPPKLYGYSKLPGVFAIKKAGKEVTPEASRAFLDAHGYSGFLGDYSLFKNGKVIGTSLLSVATTFCASHNIPLLDANLDKQLIATLFTQRKNMLTTEAATQRFAIDVEASGPHIIVAFIAYMASIGYTQVNETKNGGPYILLNGGNIHANQPLTWQYSEVKNNRGTTINLSEMAKEPGASGVKGKSGWEKMQERLANRGVALPVLSAEMVDRELVVKDQVVLIDNSVQEGLPETEADLRAHTAGKLYTVDVVGKNGLVRLNSGLYLHSSRLSLIEKPVGIQNNDQVVMVKNYGELLKAGDTLTYLNKQLITPNKEAFSVPASYYAAASGEVLTANLLKKYGISLPFTAKVLNPAMANASQDITITDAWPLNTQELAFWTEKTEARDAWYERKDLEVQTPIGDGAAPKAILFKGVDKATTYLKVGDVNLTLAELESALAR